MWTRTSQEWQRELEEIRRETSRLEKASADYSVTGSRILELAKNAHSLFIRQDPNEQGATIENRAFELRVRSRKFCPTYSKPFDLLAGGNESGDWRREWDSNSGASFRICKLQNPQC